jgi:hypothetical protein
MAFGEAGVFVAKRRGIEGVTRGKQDIRKVRNHDRAKRRAKKRRSSARS